MRSGAALHSALLAVMGVALLAPRLAERVTRPLVALGRAPRPKPLSAMRKATGRIGAAVLRARRRHRPAVGAVRRTGAGPGADDRGAARRQRANLSAVAGLCGRRCDVARAGALGRRSRVRDHEALARRRRVAAPGPGRRRARRRRRPSGWGWTPVCWRGCRPVAAAHSSRICWSGFSQRRSPLSERPSEAAAGHRMRRRCMKTRPGSRPPARRDAGIGSSRRRQAARTLAARRPG